MKQCELQDLRIDFLVFFAAACRECYGTMQSKRNGIFVLFVFGRRENKETHTENCNQNLLKGIP